MFVVKEIDLIIQYLKQFETLDEAKEFAANWGKPTAIYELLYDGQVEHRLF